MNPQEHIYKETLKRVVDNSPNYPDWIKDGLKAIIDAGRSPEEIAEGIVLFFSTNTRW